MDAKYVEGFIKTAVGNVPSVRTKLNGQDHGGAVKARFTFGRMHYRVEPGVYAIGKPNKDSPVFVSANYKLSFDALRCQLDGINAWIMVIETKGINVWCAAGKGTFGTAEIVNRIKSTQLEKIVSHKKIILPQLGAPGVAAHEVSRQTGFKVIYGPIYARDIKKFLANNLIATEQMRQVRFGFLDRLVLVPSEIMVSKNIFLFFLIGFLCLSGIYKTGYSVDLVFTGGIIAAINLSLAYLSGTAIAPLLLPWLPGKSFALKGFWLGLLVFSGVLFFGQAGNNVIEMSAWGLLICAISSFLTMNFTGTSTYTSLSGVLKEMNIALPLQIVGFVIGCGLWIWARFL